MYINNIKNPKKAITHPYGKTEKLCRVFGLK